MFAKHLPPGRAHVARQFADEPLRQQLAAAAYAVQTQVRLGLLFQL
jgi:hypothetical protein